MPVSTVLAIDLGASSGRVVAGVWDGERLQTQEVHRFANTPVVAHGTRYWDILRLWHEVQEGIQQAGVRGHDPISIGVDSWAIDYALLDEKGQMLSNPYHYRDQRTDGVMEQVVAHIGREALFTRTGLQFLPFNTIYQLCAQARDDLALLDRSKTLLMIPDLLHFCLSGKQRGEYTNATTTQLLDAHTRTWADDLLATLGLPRHVLPAIVQPGTLLGEVQPVLAQKIGFTHAMQVIVPATHDTASAVAAVPSLDHQSVYISSGTWSLVGIELNEPLINSRALDLNLTNEGGVAGTIRLLRNVGGLWLLQECQRLWQRYNQQYDWPTLFVQAASERPFASIINPDAGMFLHSDDMPAAIRAFCGQTEQVEPQSPASMVRCCLESLALRYRWVIEALEAVIGRQLTTIRIVGGGSQNTLLCQLTANVCGRPVIAGPVEATVLGNILVQGLALGLFPDLATARQVVAHSVETQRYDPQVMVGLDDAWRRFLQVI